MAGNGNSGLSHNPFGSLDRSKFPSEQPGSKPDIARKMVDAPENTPFAPEPIVESDQPKIGADVLAATIAAKDGEIAPLVADVVGQKVESSAGPEQSEGDNLDAAAQATAAHASIEADRIIAQAVAESKNISGLKQSTQSGKQQSSRKGNRSKGSGKRFELPENDIQEIVNLVDELNKAQEAFIQAKNDNDKKASRAANNKKKELNAAIAEKIGGLEYDQPVGEVERAFRLAGLGRDIFRAWKEQNDKKIAAKAEAITRPEETPQVGEIAEADNEENLKSEILEVMEKTSDDIIKIGDIKEHLEVDELFGNAASQQYIEFSAEVKSKFVEYNNRDKGLRRIWRSGPKAEQLKDLAEKYRALKDETNDYLSDLANRYNEIRSRAGLSKYEYEEPIVEEVAPATESSAVAAEPRDIVPASREIERASPLGPEITRLQQSLAGELRAIDGQKSSLLRMLRTAPEDLVPKLERLIGQAGDLSARSKMLQENLARRERETGADPVQLADDYRRAIETIKNENDGLADESSTLIQDAGIGERGQQAAGTQTEAIAGRSDDDFQSIFENFQDGAAAQEGAAAVREPVREAQQSETDNISRLFAEAANPERRENTNSPAAETPREQANPEASADYAMAQFSAHEGIWSRLVTRRMDRIKNWSEKIFDHSSGLTFETSTDIVSRGWERFKNIWDSKLMGGRNNKVIKMESLAHGANQEVASHQAAIDMYLQARNDISLPYKERIKAGKSLEKAQRALEKAKFMRDKYNSKLLKYEGFKADCHNRIVNRSMRMAELLKDKAEPFKERIADGSDVLNRLKNELSTAETTRQQHLEMYNSIRARLSAAPRAQRPAIKAQLAEMKMQMKNFDKQLRASREKVSNCESRLNHLVNLVNPWESLAQSYVEVAGRPVNWTETRLPIADLDLGSRANRFNMDNRGIHWNDNEFRRMYGDNEQYSSRDYLAKFIPFIKLDSDRDAHWSINEDNVRQIFGSQLPELPIIEIENRLARFYVGQGLAEDAVRRKLVLARLLLSQRN